MKKVVIIGVYTDNNLGDPLVFDCNKFLIEQATDQKLEIVYLDFMARKKLRPFITPDNYTFGDMAKKTSGGYRGKIKKLFGRERITALSQIIRWKKNKKKLEEYYSNGFKGADMIIIAGAGTIKWGIRRDYSRYYGLVEKYARKYSVPVVVSSAGVEDNYTEKDRRCQRFSKILSSDLYKIVTTRDNIEELRKYVKNPNTDVERVSDFGIFASDTYGIKKDNNSKCIGIGIIAGSRFAENDKDVSEDKYKKTIKGIVNLLEKQGKEWRFFTNGGIEDTVLAIELCKELELDPVSCLSVPTKPRELVEVVSQFQGIITARLHSCIVSYSLEIPFVALSWNDKVAFFARYAGCPERIITSENMDSKAIVKLLETAVEKGYDSKKMKENRDTVVEYSRKYIDVLLGE